MRIVSGASALKASASIDRSVLLSSFNVLDPDETDRLQHILDEQDRALMKMEGRLTAVLEGDVSGEGEGSS
jgi:hypothetical protein